MEGLGGGGGIKRAEMKRTDEHKVTGIKEFGSEKEFVCMCMHNACTRVTSG